VSGEADGTSGVETPQSGSGATTSSSGATTKAARAVGYALTSGAEPWHDPDREPYVDVFSPDKKVRSTLRVRSRECRTWLGGLVFENEEGAALGGQAANDAVDVLAAQAIHAGPERRVAVRLAEHKGAIYLDLGDATWAAVEIEPDGWRVVDSTVVPVRFRRPRGLRPLPVPVREARGGMTCGPSSTWRTAATGCSSSHGSSVRFIRQDRTRSSGCSVSTVRENRRSRESSAPSSTRTRRRCGAPRGRIATW
jgi:hypothetical protein